ncbi:hypothetical protein [Methylotenera sp. L2L1]|uniref:hypothetical protein n=1 Tax=Methylotenera sp. L2L1 TaxID=1502770 RepID=UPI000ACDDD17|nr:hypothetical protein [Methylotenera sp. L2L1]
MNLTLRRRAIYTGLKPFLNATEMAQALGMWETEFSLKPPYALASFVTRCCTTDALRRIRTQILRALITALESPEALLLSDPGSQVGKQTLADDKDDSTVVLDAKNSVFVALSSALWTTVDEATEKSIIDFILRNLTHLKLSSEQSRKLKDWFINRNTVFPCNFELTTLQKLINLNYIALCEYYGPVKADKLLSQATNAVEAEAIQRQFNLHDLL